MRVKGIARYPHVVTPSAPKGTEKLRFSLNVLVHKSDYQCQAITAELDAVKNNAYPSGMPPKADFCWKDCAVEEPGNAALKDYMVLTSSTNAENGRPVLVDSNLQEVIDPSVQGRMEGMVVYADVGPQAYTLGTGGVKTYLNGVMLTDEQGPIPKEALSSKPNARTMFADVTGGTVAGAAPAVPSTPTAPPQPMAPPAAPAPQPQYVMTAAANGLTREQYHASGWTDAQLVENGLMMPPAGVNPSFS